MVLTVCSVTVSALIKQNKKSSGVAMGINTELARIRTHLANERTLLAYIRTSIAFILLGLGIVKLFPGSFRSFFGGISIGIGCIILLFGFFRFWRERRSIGRQDEPDEGM